MEQKRERIIRTSRKPTIETAGEVFPDGHRIELIADPLNPGSLQLLYSNGRTSKVSSQVAHNGHIYCPAVFPPGVVQAMRLPTRLGKTIAASKLFAKISSQFRQKLDVPGDDADRLTFIPLASWFSDLLPVVPSLTICGEDASYGMDVLRLIACFCRRPLLLGSISRNAWSLVADARPTLLRFEDGMRGENGAELQPSSFRDLVSLDSRGIHNFCNTTIVFTASGPVDRAVLDSGVLVSIGAENKKGVRLPDYELKRISDEFQPLLLAYRLSHWHEVQESRFDVPDFTYPTRAIASSLAACVESDPDLTARLISLLRWQDDAVRAERCIRPEPCLVEILLGLVHQSLTTEPEEKSVAVQEITNSLNTTIRARGAIQEYCSEEVGRMLKKLCIPKRRGAAGMKVVLGTETARQAHTLACSYGVSLVKPCPQCTECAKVRV